MTWVRLLCWTACQLFIQRTCQWRGLWGPFLARQEDLERMRCSQWYRGALAGAYLNNAYCKAKAIEYSLWIFCLLNRFIAHIKYVCIWRVVGGERSRLPSIHTGLGEFSISFPGWIDILRFFVNFKQIKFPQIRAIMVKVDCILRL